MASSNNNMKSKQINQHRQKKCFGIFLLSVMAAICSFKLSASVPVNQYDRNSYKEKRIHAAINHFSLSYPLYDNNTVFAVSYADTVFSRTYKTENYKTKWKNGKPYEGIVAVSIFRKLGSLYVTSDDIKSRNNKIPSRYLEKNGKLFYWYDSSISATEESLALFKEFGLVKEPQKSEDFEEVRTIIFDDEKGVVYFFCRENPLIFETIRTNRPLGTYAPPTLECKSLKIKIPAMATEQLISE